MPLSRLICTAIYLSISSVTLAKIHITPASPVVSAGQTAQFHANEPVDWSLAPGSVGTIDPDGTYHAPTSLAANNSVGGCQVLPNDHIFNTRIDSLPLNPNSAAWMALIPPSHVGYYPAWGTNIADKSTPRKRMHFLYTPQYDSVFVAPQWPYLKLENGALSDPRSGLDRHMVVVDRDDCNFYEVYGPYDKGMNPDCGDCTGQSGLRYSDAAFDLPHGSTDAAGLPLAALSLHLEEITAGAIKHALRVTLTNSIIAPANVWPATTNARPWGKIPYGTRFRLRASFDTSHLSPIAKVLVTQLKEYGLILADGGANWEVDGSTDVTESQAVMAAFNEVAAAGVTSRDFEVVDESALMAARDSGLVRPDNGVVRPNTYAIVIARSKKNANDIAGAAIALRAVTIGMPDPAVWIQSGVTTKLKIWVNGSSDQRLQWKLDPPLGSITADGVYAAPDVSSPKTLVAIASSIADPEAQAHLLLTVIPKGPIRIDVANATGAPNTPHSHAPDYGPDANGHMWWREMGGEYSFSPSSDNWYGLPWPKTADIGLYYTSRYSLGDMVYRFLVPNGNYKVKLMYAYPCKGTYDPKTEAPGQLDSQGKAIAKNFDWGANNGHACATPTTFDMPAAVSDNSLEFALRRVTFKQIVPATALNAFLIEPDSEPPRIAVDPAHAPDVSAGQTLQFRAIGWFMGDSVKWSLEGPGSITQAGLYTAPSAPTGNSQKVVVVATSTVQPSKIARAEFALKFGDLSINPDQVTVLRGLEQKFEPQLSGVPYNNVTWSISPAIGTIASDGTYHAPETLPRDEDLVVTAASRDVAAKSANAKLHLKAAIDPIRINCGDTGPFRDAQGNLWSGDFGFTPSIGYHIANIPIKNAPPDMQPLYDSARYRYANEAFGYNFSLPNGSYTVTLKFADYYHETPQKNYFDVKLNGKEVLHKFNPTEIAGARTALDKDFTVEVTDHALRIDFLGDGGNAYISGIQILPSGSKQ